jgi:hypothetical protein
MSETLADTAVRALLVDACRRSYDPTCAVQFIVALCGPHVREALTTLCPLTATPIGHFTPRDPWALEIRTPNGPVFQPVLAEVLRAPGGEALVDQMRSPVLRESRPLHVIVGDLDDVLWLQADPFASRVRVAALVWPPAEELAARSYPMWAAASALARAQIHASAVADNC